MAYLILRITKRYSLKVIQVYAPTTSHPDDEVEALYEDISRAIQTSKTQFTVVMGDFNAKIGMREGAEPRVGKFGVGTRNPRGQRLAEFLEREGLFMMNSFFRKKAHRKWTWIHPDGSTKNEIDFILSNNRHIFNDVSVISRVKTGSDHRMVRGTLNINTRLERSRLVKSTLRPTPVQYQNPECFQLELHNRFACLEECESTDDLNNGFVQAVQAVGSQFFKTRSSKRTQKFSDHTLKLVGQRNEMRLQSSVDMQKYRELNRQISREMRRDLRLFNTSRIEEAIKRNQGSKVFARDLAAGQSPLIKLKTEDGTVVSSKGEILREVEKFYGQLYKSLQPAPCLAKDPRAKLTRHHTEDIPDVSLYEIRMALKQLKNNKAPGATELRRSF